MPRARLLFDQFIVAFETPRDLPAPESDRLLRALNRPDFPVRLRRAIHEWLRQSPEFADVTVTLTR